MPKRDFNKVAKHIFRIPFPKNISGRLLLYLFALIATPRQTHIRRRKNRIPLFNVEHDYFKTLSSLQL